MRKFNHYVIIEFTMKTLFGINCAAFTYGIIALFVNVLS